MPVENVQDTVIWLIEYLVSLGGVNGQVLGSRCLDGKDRNDL